MKPDFFKKAAAVQSVLLPIVLAVLLSAASFTPIVYSFFRLSNNHYTEVHVDLGTDAPLYVKKGFSETDKGVSASYLKDSDSASGPWRLYHGFGPRDTAAPVKRAPLEGLPQRFFLDPRGSGEQEFAFAVPFFLSAEKKEKITRTTPGLFLNSIGDNWEIYLNGTLVARELHLDAAGKIRSHRSWRYPFFPLERNMFKEGENLLAFRIVGDPTSESTGFFYGAPYYIDDYAAILNDHAEYPIFFLCGIYLFMAVYHVLLYMMHPESRYYLFHSVVSVILGLYFLFRSNVIYRYIPDSAITTRVEYTLIFTLIPFFGIYYDDFSEQKSPLITKAVMAISIFLALLQAVMPLPFGDDVLTVFQILSLLFVAYLMIYDVGYRTLFRGYRKWKQNYSSASFWNFMANFIKSPVGNFFVGIVFLVVSGVFDVVDSLFFKWGFVATRYSFFIFTIGTSLILARDFARLHNKLASAITELEWANVNLETKIHNRTRELEIQTKKAKAASRAKGEFLARISHEIRTPLNAIIGLSEIELQKKFESSETEENLGTIYNSGSMLLSIINEILDISKIEAGRFELSLAEYSIESLIADAVNLNLYRIASKPLVFELKAGEDLPSRLLGDELRVKQILNNLLSNAFKYTNEGKVVLSVACEKPDSQSGRKVTLRFSVSDTGVGIKAEDINKLFDDYTQLDYRSDRPVEGSGLGLAIAMGLAKKMDGTITVESEFGRGSVFTAVIVQEDTGAGAIGRIAADNLGNIRFFRNLRTKNAGLLRKPMPYGRVLVVDDFKSNLAVTRGLLTPYQISADCVLSGPEAVEKVKAVEAGRTAPYDLIFMDHMMPGMDGIETARIIRGLGGAFAGKVPIVALTANASAGMTDLFASEGFNGFISKPIDLWLLDGILNQWIRDKHPQEAAEAEAAAKSAAAGQGGDPFGDISGLYIEGLDIAGGVERYGGLKAYLEITGALCAQAESVVEQLRDPRRDLASYAVAIHGVKGSLFGICAPELGGKAELLERAAKAGSLETILEKTPEFIRQFEELVLKLKKLEPGQKEKKGRKAKPPEESLAELLKASGEFNLDKMESIINTLAEYDYDSGGEIVPWLQNKLRDLEYGDIIERLSGVIAG
ncbi:MAG: response regulator [Treponema sp.]|nr:response regulator [Treponema sp.]